MLYPTRFFFLFFSLDFSHYSWHCGHWWSRNGKTMHFHLAHGLDEEQREALFWIEREGRRIFFAFPAHSYGSVFHVLVRTPVGSKDVLVNT
jgi:hypothetical protein